MQTLPLLKIISMGLLIFAVTACNPVPDLPQGAPTITVLPTNEEVPGTKTEIAATSTMTPAASTIPPVVTEVQETFTVIDLLHCGEIFCQAPWDGFLNRPIGETFRDTIDPTYPYASTRDGTLEIHHGVEFVNSSGTPVMAAQDGEVVYAGTDMDILMGPYNNFYGNVVILKHPDLFDGKDIFSLYAHLSVMGVEVGDQVKSGESIGNVGATGSAIGSHLHFEVRVGQNDYDHTVNPILWFPAALPSEKYRSAVLAGKITDRNGDPVQDLSISLERLGPNGGIEAYIYGQTYQTTGINGYPDLEENFAIPDIPPGEYRLAFVYGTLHEVFFTLEPGYLGFVEIQLDQ